MKLARSFGILGITLLFICTLTTLGTAQTTPEVPPMELIGAYGGACLSIDVQGDYAYVGQGMNLVVYDISAYRPPYPPDYLPPAQPLQVGRVLLNGVASKTIVDGNRVFAATGESGIQVIDISNPGQPKNTSTFATDGNAYDIALQEGYLYVTWSTPDRSTGGVSILETEVSGALELVGEYVLPGAQAIAVAGTRAYAGRTTNDLIFEIVTLDVANPHVPTVFRTQEVYCPPDAIEVSPAQHALYVAHLFPTRMSVWSTESGELLNEIPVGLNPRVHPVESGIFIINSYSSSPNESDSLALMDASSPGLLEEFSRVLLQDTPRCVDVTGDLVVCGSESGCVQVVLREGLQRLQPLADPVSKGQLDRIALEGQRAYLTYTHGTRGGTQRYPGAIDIVDVSVPSLPRLVGTFNTLSRVDSVYDPCYVSAFEGNLGCIAWGTSNGGVIPSGPGVLEVVDLQDPLQPRGGSIELEAFPAGIAVQGTTVCVVTRPNDLLFQMFDVSDPAIPEKVGETSLYTVNFGGVPDIQMEGDLLYVVLSSMDDVGTEVYVINVQNPADPYGMGAGWDERYGMSWGAIDGLCVEHGIAYVSVRYGDLELTGSGFAILDLLAPRSIGFLGRFAEMSRPIWESDIGAAHGCVYLATGRGGISRFDVQDTSSPVSVDTGTLKNFRPFRLIVRDGFVFALSETSGLAILNEHRFPLITSTSGHGTIDPGPSERMVNEGSDVTLTAVPDSQYEFLRWEGDVAGDPTANPLTFTMDSKKTISATFQDLRYSLQVAVEGHGYTDPAPGEYRIVHDTPVSVSAVPQDGWRFDHWEGDYSSDAGTSPTTVTMTGDKSLKAVFVPVMFTLTMNATGSGTTSPEAGTHTLQTGTSVNAVAMPAEGWQFVRWDGDISGDSAANPMAFTLASDMSITAVFEPIPRTLALAIEGNGSTDPAPGQYVHPHGTPVTLTATPDSGWRLDHWDSGGLKNSTDNPAVVTMDADKIITAVFVPMHYVLNTQMEGLGSIFPFVGSQEYPENAEIEVLATPQAGWRFDHWEGDTTGDPASASQVLIMSKDLDLAAVFVQMQSTLTVAAQGQGATNPEPGQHSYPTGSQTVVTATPAEGWVFDRWEGDVVGDVNDNPATVAMDADRAITAVFVEEGSSFGCAGETSDNKNVPASVGDVTLLGLAAVGLLARNRKRSYWVGAPRHPSAWIVLAWGNNKGRRES